MTNLPIPGDHLVVTTIAYNQLSHEGLWEARVVLHRRTPQGSVVNVRNSSGTQTVSATYWPYEEICTSTGTNPCQFDFVGSLGYYRENSTGTYVRARFLRREHARCMKGIRCGRRKVGFNIEDVSASNHPRAP